MTISNNILEAFATGMKYHIISSNEVHSFNNNKEAKKDLAIGKRFVSKNEKVIFKTLSQIQKMLF